MVQKSKSIFRCEGFRPKRSEISESGTSQDLSNQWEGEKRMYNERVLEVENATFTPLVFSVYGGMAQECSVFYKRLSQRKGARVMQRWIHGYEQGYRSHYSEQRLCRSEEQGIVSMGEKSRRSIWSSTSRNRQCDQWSKTRRWDQNMTRRWDVKMRREDDEKMKREDEMMQFRITCYQVCTVYFCCRMMAKYIFVPPNHLTCKIVFYELYLYWLYNWHVFGIRNNW